MWMEDRSWMYQLGDVLAHFKGVSLFLEAATQHATREKQGCQYFVHRQEQGGQDHAFQF
jgi:hypothetical protein